MIEEVLDRIQKEKMIERKDIVLLGLSGGADSVCLLLVLLELQKRLDFSLQAIHIEHGIRGEESLRDAGFLTRLCREKGISCRIFHVDVPREAAQRGVGIEEAARELRYACYQKAAEDAWERGESRGEEMPRYIKVALAHHANDNAETLLFHMIRGSGFKGLGGMRRQRELSAHALVIRPLLARSRKEIEQYLNQQGQDFCRDSTNLDMDYSRNKLRHQIIPLMEEINQQAVAHMVRAAGELCEISDYLKGEAEALLPKVCRREKAGCLLLEDLFSEYPSLLQREIVYGLLVQLSKSSKDIRAVHVQSVQNLAKLQVGRQIALPYGVAARRVYEGVLLTSANLNYRKSEEGQEQDKGIYEITPQMLACTENGEAFALDLPSGQIRLRVLKIRGEICKIEKKKYTKWLDYDMIKHSLQIRTRQSGDYLVIDDAGHKKKLKKYLIEEKLPKEQRERLWLVADGSHILWVIGGRISAAYKVRESTKQILEIQMTGGNDYED
ncbi:MAG: tRNA lysidine(34) synthetase TilS [Roseburia sp.]